MNFLKAWVCVCGKCPGNMDARCNPGIGLLLKSWPIILAVLLDR